MLFTTRMLTLSGPGGIGKTRLALRTLHALAEEFPDGACFVELADLANPDLVVAAVASAVGVAEEQGRPLLDTLADALRPRRMLLALDNCEHLVEASARVCHRLLASAPFTSWYDLLPARNSSYASVEYVAHDKPHLVGGGAIHVSCCASGNGSGRSSRVLTTLNTAMFAPIASANDATAMAVKPGFLRRMRAP